MSDHDASRPADDERQPPLPYRQRVIYIVGLAAVIVVVLVLLWWLRWVFTLAFAAVLLAVFLRSGADLLGRLLGPVVSLGAGLRLTLFCLLVVGLIVGFFFLAVPSLSKQAQQLGQRLPESIESGKEQLRESRWGTWVVEEGEAIVDQLRPTTAPQEDGDQQNAGEQDAGEDAGRQDAATRPSVEQRPPDTAEPAAPRDGGIAGTDAQSFFQNLVRWAGGLITVIIGVLFVLFTGLYLAAEPGLYQRGILWLVPPRGRKKADCVLRRVGHTLKYWLMGQLVAMLAVGLLTGIGLWILGAPLPFVSAVLAAVLEFVPNVGPTIAAGLPTLLALPAEGRFLSGPSLALAVLILFMSVQFAESYLLTPLIQRRAVELPPAMLITTQLSAAILLGPVGIVIAAPLVASVMAMLRELVVEGDPDREHPKDRSHEGDSGGT